MIFWSLIALVILSPIPFGSIYPWSYTLMGSAVGVLLLAWTITTAVSREGPAVSLRMVWPLVGMFALVAAWIALQTATWTPESWHHPLWRNTAEMLGMEIQGRISVAPFDTGTGLMRFLAYGGIFWLSLQYCRSSRNAYRVFLTLAMAGTAYAVYGLVIEFSGAEMILWYDKERYQESLTSTFRYKNAYATYAGLGALCAIGLLLNGAKDIADHCAGRRETLHQFVTALSKRGWILVVSAILIITALLLSDSRAGFLSAGVGFAVLFVAAHFTRGAKLPYAGVTIAVFIIAFSISALLSGATTLDRLAQTDTDKEMRSQIYDATNIAIADAPWLGSGSGTYYGVFQQYHPPSIGTRVGRAHSSYLENALELGIAASALLALVIAATGLICAIGVWRRRRDAIYPCIGLAATILIGLHAGIDFTMQVPAVAATYFLLVGAACGQSWSSLARA